MVGRLALAYVAGVLTVLVAIIWAVPLVAGPFSVDCGGLEPAACESRWRRVGAEQGHWLPITHIEIDDAPEGDEVCGSYYIERWVFASISTYDCL